MSNERKEYLQDLADDYGVPYYIVEAIAELLGEGEDYDGLVAMVEDYSMGIGV